MKKLLITDGHSDFLEKCLDKKIHINDGNLMFNIEEAYKFKPYVQFGAIFIHTKYVKEDDTGYDRTLNMIDNFEKEYMLFKDKYNLQKITSKETLNKVLLENKIGILLSIENLGCIGNKISRIDELYNKGIRVMSLTWNDQNSLASGAKVVPDTGITCFGKKCIEKMDKLGIVIDVSHLSKNSFKDLMKIDPKYVVATHSNAKNIYNNVRNLDDDEIKYVAKKNGVIGINLYKYFLTDKNNYATIDDVISHITYISNLVGVNHVGLGSDFDGVDKDDLPIGVKGVGDIDKIIDRMITRGFSNNEIEKIIGDNWFRYLSNVI